MFSVSRRLIAVALLTLAALPGVGRAATPYLVKDIRTGAEPAASQPRELGHYGGAATFVADDRVPNELWRSDGTAAGTRHLADLCAGECSTTPRLLASTSIGAFYATDAGTGALWLTRGSEADTVQVAKDVEIVPDGPAVWVAPLGKLFFTAADAERGIEPWVSDGTAAGTRSLDVRPGLDSSLPGELATFAGRLYFAADHDGGGAALWTSDGTPAGTKLVLRTAPGNAFTPRPRFLTALEKRLVFFAPKAKKGVELWASDGTAKGTILLADLASGGSSPDVHFVQAVGGRAFLGIDTSKRGYELWVTDGTAKGTQSLGLASPGPVAYEASLALLPLGDRRSVVIPRLAPPGYNSWEPWVSNGTRAGTRLLADLCPGPSCAIEIRPLGAAGPRSLFTVRTERHSQELWATDGTTAGTARVAELCLGCSSMPRLVGNLSARALFTATGPSGGWDLWVTDGTAAGTTRITAGVTLGTSDSTGGVLAAVHAGSVLLFAARDDAHSVELWRTDGTAAGTHLVADVAAANLASSRPRRFAAAGARLYFLAEDGTHGYEPWTSDGTDAGTHLVADLVPGPQPNGFHDPNDWQLTSTAAMGDGLVFPRRFGQDGLWRTDGTAAGTIRLTPAGVTARAPVALGGTVFFIGVQANDTQLWKTDGTPAGTAQLTSLTDQPRSLAAWNGKLYFLVDEGDGTAELWRSDGTSAGTAPVADVDVGDPSASFIDPRLLTAARDALYFVADGPTEQLWRSDGTASGTARLAELWLHGSVVSIVPLGSGAVVLNELDGWASDGTAAGTRRLTNVSPAFHASEMRPVAVGGVVYFQGLGPLGYAGPNILWRTDGTEAGTYPMIDARGHTFAAAESLRAFGGKLVFAAADGGYEALWESDGTPLGTRVVHRLGSRPDYGWLGELLVVGSRLYFAAFSHDHGMELWALPQP